MSKLKTRHSISNIFPVILFILFAFCIITVLVLASSFYRKTVVATEVNDNVRTAISYIREKSRQTSGVKYVVTECGDTIIFNEGMGYGTFVYAYEGDLMEIFTDLDSSLVPGDGVRICSLLGMSVEEKSSDNVDYLIIDMKTDDENENTIVIEANTGADFE